MRSSQISTKIRRNHKTRNRLIITRNPIRPNLIFSETSHGSVAGRKFPHPRRSGQVWVGHKPDLARPMDTPKIACKDHMVWFSGIRALPSGVPNANYLAFGTPNTKNRLSWGVLNAKKIWDMLQYALIFDMVRMKMPNQTNHFLFNIFSLLSIFYSTFFSLQPALSFFLL